MSYDTWRSTLPDQDEVVPVQCPVCTGHDDAAPCSEECAELVERVNAERRIKGLFFAAYKAIRLARTYGPGPRSAACVEWVNKYRYQIRRERTGT